MIREGWIKLLNVSQIIWNELISDKLATFEEVDVLIELFQYYNINDIVYPNILNRKLKCNSEKSIKILEALTEYGILKRIYKYYCYDCLEYNIFSYNTIGRIEGIKYCDNCGRKLSFEKNVTFVYKVIKVDE